MFDSIRDRLRRARAVLTAIDPRPVLASPWGRLGVAAAIGFSLGRPRGLRGLSPTLRTLAGGLATAVVRELMRRGPEPAGPHAPAPW